MLKLFTRDELDLALVNSDTLVIKNIISFYNFNLKIKYKYKYKYKYKKKYFTYILIHLRTKE